MKTIVCIKQVPSTNEVRLDPKTNTIIRDGKQSVVNPYDTFAIEEAIKIKEMMGGEVIGLSMGIPMTERLLRDAMSRGLDQSVLLSDRRFAGADTLATAYTLSLGIKDMGDFDLILCGKMAIDGDTGQIGPELAEFLGIPHITDVKEIMSVGPKSLVCKKVTDHGYEIIKAAYPLLLTVLKDMNIPRLPSIAGIKRGQEAPFVIKDAGKLNADESMIGLKGSPTQVFKTYVPKKEKSTVQIHGSKENQAKELVEIIKGVV